MIWLLPMGVCYLSGLVLWWRVLRTLRPQRRLAIIGTVFYVAGVVFATLAVVR